VNKEIKIDGLTMKQVVLLNKLWNFQTLEEFEDWSETLSVSEAKEASMLKDLLMFEIIDSELADEAEFPIGKEICKKFML
jgi:hypothetical protein